MEYTPAGNPSIVIRDQVSSPVAIAFDGPDDLWVNSGYSNLTIYPQGYVGQIVSFNDNNNFITGVAVYKAFAW